MSLSLGELARFVAELAAARQRWRHLVRYANEARVYEQIWDDEQVNAWVICWSENQDTGFHDHDESVAIHRVLHAGVAPAVTIHAYSPPLVRTGVYRVGAGGELERRSLSVEEELRAEEELALAGAGDSIAGPNLTPSNRQYSRGPRRKEADERHRSVARQQRGVRGVLRQRQAPDAPG